MGVRSEYGMGAQNKMTDQDQRASANREKTLGVVQANVISGDGPIHRVYIRWAYKRLDEGTGSEVEVSKRVTDNA